jgi:hypothetical protein
MLNRLFHNWKLNGLLFAASLVPYYQGRYDISLEIAITAIIWWLMRNRQYW